MKKLLLLTLGFFASVSVYHAQCDQPVVVSPQSYCGGGTSILLDAEGTDPSLTYTINMFDSWGDGWNGHEITLDVGGVTAGPFGVTNAQGSFNSETFTVIEGDLITATWTAGSFASEISFEIVDNNGVIVFSGVVDDAINYTVPEIGPYTLTWYDAPGGTVLGTGTSLEAVGTSVMPTASTGSYSFFVTQTGVACTESGAVELVVDITDVNVDLTAVDETCTGTSDGTFSIANVDCGTAPFSFSVDGGAFGPAPTDLTAGTYVVIVQDGASLNSSPITVVIETINTVIPSTPTTADSVLSSCGGVSSILVDADASPSGAPATFTLNMIDSWGDGWNGNAITILADGVPVLVGATFTSGSNATETFTAAEGSTLTATWTPGAFKMKFRLK